MAYRYGEDRRQMIMFPKSVDEYVLADDPVRAYNVFVDTMDLESLGITIEDCKVGNPAYDPRSMLKLLVYAYSYGTRSSRKIERAVHHNISFIWLMGGLRPDYKTISEFRRSNKKALKRVLRQCARMCIKLELIDGNILFVDGTKIRAQANIKNSWDKKKCAESIAHLDTKIDALLAECDAIDREESDQESYVKMKEELSSAQTLKEKVVAIAQELAESEKKSLNTTDSECGRMNSVEGSLAGYNVQSTVDEKHGLIVTTDATNASNDKNQLATQIETANEIVDNQCSVAVADTGYASTEEMVAVAQNGITPVVPPRTKKDEHKGFTYDAQRDCYVCPQGKLLTNRGTINKGKLYSYKIQGSSTCCNCPRNSNGTCTTVTSGKRIAVMVNENERQYFEDIYHDPEMRTIYRLRQQKVELPFGHIKRNQGFRQFLLRGKDGADAEISLAATCFNVVRMITILGGAQSFMSKIATLA
jgi:transposase